MSGLELFGAIGSALTVVEAFWLAKSHATSIAHAKQEKIDMEMELKELKLIVQHIFTALNREPYLSSRTTLLPLVSKVEERLKIIDIKRKGAWKIFWHKVKHDIRIVWGDLERMRGFLELGLISQIGENVEEQQHENASRYATLMEELTHDLDDIRKEVFRGNTRIEKRLDDALQQEIQRWLSPESVHVELDELRMRRAKDSGTWLLRSDLMMKWFDSRSTTKMVIVTGPAGCGKTMLSSMVADFLNQKGEMCLPIFIKHAAQMDFYTVLRYLLSTTLAFTSTIHPRLKELHSRRTIQEADLSAILQEVIRAHLRKVYIVVDGLDELHSSGAYLLDQLSSFENAQLFVTSRPAAVPNRFQPNILDLESSNESDLCAYIEEGVTSICDKIPRCQSSTLQVVGNVADASCGLFILASMHITTLRKARTKRELMDLAATLPRTPNEYYRSTLERIRHREPIDSDPALATLLWVFRAKRPLHVEELPVAVASALYDLTEEIVEDCIRTHEELLELCEGLLWVKDGIVGFSHLTVQEFFTDMGETSFLLSRSCSGTSQVPCLGVACLGFLNAQHDKNCLAEWQTSVELNWRWRQDRSFLTYSSQFWGHHLSRIPSSQALSTLSRFEHNSSVFRAASECLTMHTDLWHSPYVLTKQSILATFNLAAYLEVIGNADLPDRFGRSPLWHACHCGHIETTSLLLMGPHLEADSRDNDGRSPLSVACQYGHIDIVRLLLTRPDVEADSRDNSGESPLWIACKYGSVEISRILLERPDIEADSRNKDGKSALLVACLGGHVEIARLLLARADVEADSRDNDGQSPLWWACCNGHLEIARLLLARPDVEIDSQDNDGQSPLSVACQCGHLEIARLFLVRPEVKSHSRGKDGRSPLWAAFWAASRGGHVEIANLLRARLIVDI